MKLLNRVGDALLDKLVPGIHAKAGCGKCSYAYKICSRHCLSPGHECSGYRGTDEYVYFDDCGYECDRWCGNYCC